MTSEKLILIGCDDTVTLSMVLNGIKGTALLPHHIISATRVLDLLDMVKSLNPDLVMLIFRNNQLVLNDLGSYIRKPEIPILCLTRNFENEKLQWPQNNIVFVYPLMHTVQQGLLDRTMNSIMLLKTAYLSGPDSGSLAEVSIQYPNQDATRNLSRYVMELDQKTDTLAKIKDRIAELYPRVNDPVRMELTSIVNAIKASSNDTKLWQDFKVYFEQTDPHFLLNLAQKYPQLTTIDLKYCCYLKMNMSNDDICNLLGINQESVRTHKYRLKKKMSLAKNQDLRSYLRSVYQ